MTKRPIRSVPPVVPFILKIIPRPTPSKIEPLIVANNKSLVTVKLDKEEVNLVSINFNDRCTIQGFNGIMRPIKNMLE